MTSNMTNNDLDESSIAMEMDFTIPGLTRRLHVDEDPDLVSSPPSLKESKEEQRK
jgi:hypothetical protein